MREEKPDRLNPDTKTQKGSEPWSAAGSGGTAGAAGADGTEGTPETGAAGGGTADDIPPVPVIVLSLLMSLRFVPWYSLIDTVAIASRPTSAFASASIEGLLLARYSDVKPNDLILRTNIFAESGLSGFTTKFVHTHRVLCGPPTISSVTLIIGLPVFATVASALLTFTR